MKWNKCNYVINWRNNIKLLHLTNSYMQSITIALWLKVLGRKNKLFFFLNFECMENFIKMCNNHKLQVLVTNHRNICSIVHWKFPNKLCFRCLDWSSPWLSTSFDSPLPQTDWQLSSKTESKWRTWWEGEARDRSRTFSSHGANLCNMTACCWANPFASDLDGRKTCANKKPSKYKMNSNFIQLHWLNSTKFFQIVLMK